MVWLLDWLLDRLLLSKLGDGTCAVCREEEWEGLLMDFPPTCVFGDAEFMVKKGRYQWPATIMIVLDAVSVCLEPF